MGIISIAEPINTMLIVEMIGVTLFLEKEEKSRHKYETVSITKLEKINPMKNLYTILSILGSYAKRPSWNTTNIPSPNINVDANNVYAKK